MLAWLLPMAIIATSMFHKITRMKAPTTKIGDQLKWGGFEKIEKNNKNYPRFRSAGSQTGQFSKVVLTQQLSKVLLFQKMIFLILKVIKKKFQDIP
jgi:hypothetical protein